MLREAQRENSARSSARVSPINSALMSVSSTCKNSPSVSPKSPPNSPNTELIHFEETLKGVIVNRLPGSGSVDGCGHYGDESPFDWRSRPHSQPPRSWRIAGSSGSGSKASSGCHSEAEERQLRGGGSRKDSGDERDGQLLDSRLMTALVASNLLTFTCGLVLGYWFYRRGLNRVLDSASGS